MGRLILDLKEREEILVLPNEQIDMLEELLSHKCKFCHCGVPNPYDFVHIASSDARKFSAEGEPAKWNGKDYRLDRFTFECAMALVRGKFGG